jgi:hypothetical protein
VLVAVCDVVLEIRRKHLCGRHPFGNESSVAIPTRDNGDVTTIMSIV